MRVLRSNMFRNSVVVLPDGGQETEMSLEDWQALKPTRAEVPPAPSAKEQKPQNGNGMMVVSAAPETLDDDLAGLEPVDGAQPVSHEPSMMNSEEATHRRRRPHHHQEQHDRSRRSRPAREPKEPASNDDASDRSAQ